MKKILYISFVFIVFLNASSIHAETPTALAEQAQLAFKQQDYAKAAQLWEDLRQLGFDNLSLHYNLAQAYWQLGQKGQSLAALYRAKKFDQGHPQLRQAIQLAEQTLQIPQNEFLKSLDFFPWWRLHLKRDQALWFLALSTFVFFAYLIFAHFRGKTSFLMRALTLSLVLLALWQLAYYFSWKQQALVIVPQASLKKAPLKEAAVLADLPEGTRLDILESSAAYYLVQSPSGQKGYLPQAVLGEI